MSNPFDVLSKQLDNAFVSPFSNRTAEENREIIGNELSNIAQGLPLVGGGIDMMDSAISSSIEAFQNLLTNPVGAAEMALQGLKVRKVINNFFDGIDGLVRNGKLISKGNAIQMGIPEVTDDDRQIVISKYTDWTPIDQTTTKVKTEQSELVTHKGHGFTYDSRGNATPDPNGTTELGDKERFPSYASMDNFFKTTIGTDFYWGIKVAKDKEWSYADLPEPIFCDKSKSYANGNGFYFNGWLPAQSYQFSDYVSAEIEDISSAAFVLSLPAGYKLGNRITTTLIETDMKSVSEWLEEYRDFTTPSPRITLPYKNCVYRMTIYTYRPTGALIRKYPFYVTPDITQSLEGENTMSATYPSIPWIIVGRALSSTKDDKK